MDEYTLAMDHQGFTSLCDQCLGFCCRALCFKASDGFPVDKDAGTPCPNLDTEYRCIIHSRLAELKMKGCLAYDCFGAGQKVANLMTRQADENEMFEVFQVMRQLHEILWYLADAKRLSAYAPEAVKQNIEKLTGHIYSLTLEKSHLLRKLDMEPLWRQADGLLMSVSSWYRESVQHQDQNVFRKKKKLGQGLDLIGAHLRGANLRGQSLKGAYLIAADLRNSDLTGTDLRGADLRDADLSNANLEGSLFVTQNQINSAVGNSKTKLPGWISRPAQWV